MSGKVNKGDDTSKLTDMFLDKKLQVDNYLTLHPDEIDNLYNGL